MDILLADSHLLLSSLFFGTLFHITLLPALYTKVFFLGIFNTHSLSRTVVKKVFLYTRVVYDLDLAVYNMI